MIFITGKENNIEEPTSTIFLGVSLALPVWKQHHAVKKFGFSLPPF